MEQKHILNTIRNNYSHTSRRSSHRIKQICKITNYTDIRIKTPRVEALAETNQWEREQVVDIVTDQPLGIASSRCRSRPAVSLNSNKR